MRAVTDTKHIKMKDKGFYDNHSQTQRAAINASLPYIEKALSTIKLPSSEKPFVIVDYGCSEGKNSLYAVQAMVDYIQRRQKQQAISVTFNDLPSNNFNKLFENIANANDSDSVLYFASAKPFHQQIMSSATVHFGYSASAAHWLTDLPKNALSKHTYVSGASKGEQQRLAKIAAKDWQNFLQARAKEMAQSGKILITMAANLTGSNKYKNELNINDTADKQAFDKRKGAQEIYSAQIIMSLIDDILQQFLSTGKISQEQLDNVCSPIYPRNMDELLAPLKNSDLKQQFTIEDARLITIACPLFKNFLRTGDAETYAASLTEIFRAFTESYLLYQLFGIDERRRSARLRLAGQQIIDELYDRTHTAIKSKPEYYTIFPIHSMLVLEKK